MTGLTGPAAPAGRAGLTGLTWTAGLTGLTWTAVTTAHTATDMRVLGERLAEVVRPGDLILADGPLGAGKTVLAQGLGAGLGVRDGLVKSPTYTVADRHDGGRVPLVHIDAWRLGSAAELDDLDLDVGDAVTFVEWGSGRAEQLRDSHLLVRIDRREDDSRTVELTAAGGDWAERLERIRRAASTAGTDQTGGPGG